MVVVYSPRYHIDIGLHVFPTLKYRRVFEALTRSPSTAGRFHFVEPEPAEWEQLALVHTAEYLAKLRYGTMTRADLAELELPWSGAMVEGFRLMAGGTIRAALLACGLDDRTQSSRSSPSRSPEGFPAAAAGSAPNVVAHIGGGLHHAFPNHGEGFCPVNDVAVAARVLQASGVGRIAVIDLDVHHGNGTSFIFESDPRVYTFSMHQQYNYPMWKPRSSLDIGLPDGAGDATYLAELERALLRVMSHRPECVFYLAGADPFENDQLGGLRLTRDGLRQRDRMVVEAVRHASVPLVVTLAGGYAQRVEDTVAIHVATIEEALQSATPTAA